MVMKTIRASDDATPSSALSRPLKVRRPMPWYAVGSEGEKSVIIFFFKEIYRKIFHFLWRDLQIKAEVKTTHALMCGWILRKKKKRDEQ